MPKELEKVIKSHERWSAHMAFNLTEDRNMAKPDWESESMESLIDGLHGEVIELLDEVVSHLNKAMCGELKPECSSKVMAEAADVANFAFMLAETAIAEGRKMNE